MLAFWDLSTFSPFNGTDEDFGEVYYVCLRHPKGEFFVQNECLFKGIRLCVPRCGTRGSMEVLWLGIMERTRA